MIYFFLTLFVIVITPVPWWLILFHILVQKESRILAYLSYFSVCLVWVILGYFLFQHQDLLFGHKFLPNIFSRIIGIIFFAMAVIVDWNVIKTLGLKRLAMLPEFNRQDEAENFVATGIYRYSRHPRYVEYMLISTSAGFFFGYWFMFGFLAYLVMSFWLATIAEEAELIKRFGDSYRDYRKKVPRFFIC